MATRSNRSGSTRTRRNGRAAQQPPKGRKQYVVGVKAGGGFDITKQPESVRPFVSSHLDDRRSGFGLRTYGDKNREDIAKEKKRRAARARNNPSLDIPIHTMTAAKKRLRKGWKRSLDTTKKGGSALKKVQKNLALRGMSAAAAKKHARDNHGVKFGVDPYHK